MFRQKYFLIPILVALLTVSISSANEADSLRHYLKIAAENNPKLQADFLGYKASLQKVPQAGAFSDLTLDVGLFIEPMEVLGGKQVASITLMQMFPWFGTRKAARSEAQYMAKANYELFQESRDAIFLEVYTQWYLLGSLNQRLKNSQENHTLLLQLQELAKRKFSSPVSTPTASYTPSTTTPPQSATLTSTGGSMGNSMGSMGGGSTEGATSGGNMGGGMESGMSDAMASAGGGGLSEILRIDLEIIELESDMETILSEIKTEKAKLNTLLNRPTNSELTTPESIEQVAYRFDSYIIDQIKENNPMLEMIQQEAEAYKAMGRMNHKMSLPMLGIGVQYMVNKKTSDEMFGMGSMNGKDMIMPMVSMTLPIFRGKYKAQQRESKLRWEASQEQYNNTLNTLESDLARVLHQLNDASRKIQLYQRQTEIAESAYNLAVREFISGTNDLTNIIQIHRQLLEYKLKQSLSTAEYNIMVATVQRLISFNEFDQSNRE